ncbi:hypothetical protein GCM10010236_39470 [Streptomyces eurythermus]|nr:hypothetical protein GCM10010236_39470 [Streptomyces eurythermus]
MSTPPADGDEPRHVPSSGEPCSAVSVSPSGGPDHVPPPGEPRYEPPPGPGRLALWILLFAAAALAVVLGGIYFT